MFKAGLEINMPTNLISSNMVRSVAVDAIAIMRQRVQGQGRNLQDQQMGKYSKSTKRHRAKRGRQTAYRDLTDTGRMMRAIHVMHITKTQQGHVAVIGFSTAHARKIAAAHQEREPWFGLSRQDKQTLTAIAARRVQAGLQRKGSQ